MANYTVSFYPEAEKEVLKAFLWYTEIKTGLGNEFRESVKNKINSIQRNPKSASFIYKDLRNGRLKRFPFNIIYRISNLNIQVLAVFHHSRNPYEWKARI